MTSLAARRPAAEASEPCSDSRSSVRPTSSKVASAPSDDGFIPEVELHDLVQTLSLGQLPVAPLQRRVAAGGGFRALWRDPVVGDPGGALTRLQREEKAYHRAVRNGRLTVYCADTLAVHLLGMHPAAVWGWCWYAANEECDQREADLSARR